MAIKNSDGSIILKTAVDTAGLSKGLKNLKAVVKTAAKSFLIIGGALTAVTGMAVKTYAEFEQLAGGAELMFGNAVETVKKNAKEAYATVQMSQNEYLRQVNGFATGLKTALGGNEQAAADLAHRIIVAEADIVAATGETQENIQNAFNGIMKNNFTMLDNLKLGITPTKEGYQEVIDKVNAWNEANDKATKYQMGNLADMQAALVDYVEMQGMAGYAAREAAETIQGSTAMFKASWENLITAMASGEGLDDAINGFIFSLEKLIINIAPVIQRTLLGLGQAIQKVLPVLVQTITSVLIQQIPGLVAATYNMIIALFNGVVQGIKALFSGGTAKAVVEIKSGVSDVSVSADAAAQGMNDVAGATKKAGKEAQKALASFDDLNILTSSNASGDVATPSGAAGTPDVSMPTITSSGGDQGAAAGGLIQTITAQLATIMAVAGGALLAIGLLLLFSGAIGWGIKFIIVGAAMFSIGIYALTQEDTQGTISTKLMEILAIAGIALTAIGLILLFSGAILWGIAFIIAGASALSVAIVAVESGKVEGEAERVLQEIMILAGVCALALGVILMCCGVINPLSIGLLVVGAASLAGAVAINPGGAAKIIQDFFKKNSKEIATVSSALLIIGIFMCICGVITPLSVGLIVAGAAGLAAVIALNWDYVKEKISTFFTDNAAFVVNLSLGLLVLGIILAVTGVNLPLGIGLIALGAAGLVAVVVLNWDYIKDKITTFFQDNAGLVVGVSLALLVLGIILIFTGVGIPLAIGLIAAGAVGLVAVVALNWDYIKEKVSSGFEAISEWVKTWGLLVLGIILICSGLGIPLGIALLIKGGQNLSEAQDPLWETIVNKVKGVWEKIKNFWNTNIAPIFTAKWWKQLGIDMINGLIAGVEGGINGIIGAFESMINWIVNGINKISFDVPDWVPGIGGKKFGFNLSKASFSRVSIPRLAQGAVIPPNREFLAVLGDQKTGTNIEAPAELIKQMAMEAIAESGYTGQPIREEHYYLNETELMSIIYKLVRGGERLQGTSLVSGGTY